MSLIATERSTYEEMWSHDAYASFSPGEHYADVFMEMSGATEGSILDAGAGSGKGALALKARGFNHLTLCDITWDGLVPEAKSLPFYQVCLWKNIKAVTRRHDWAYCTDVLEHIPTPFTMLVAQRVLDACTRGAFFSIALVPDRFGAVIGKPLHQTVQSFVEWRDQLNAIGFVKECRDLAKAGLYLVEPR